MPGTGCSPGVPCGMLRWTRSLSPRASQKPLSTAIFRRKTTSFWRFSTAGRWIGHSAHPEGRLLAIFDVFDDWFQRDDHEACRFINVLLEMGADHPLGRANAGHLAYLRDIVSGFAAEAGLTNPDEFARSWHILMKGCIVLAAEGDRCAARRARALGAMLIAATRAIEASD